MLAQASGDRKSRDHSSGHHHHPMVGRVYSFDASLVGGKVSQPTGAVSKAGGSSFYGVSSPPLSNASTVALISHPLTTNAANKKTRLDQPVVPSQQVHTSPTTTPPTASATPPAPLRCTICNGTCSDVRPSDFSAFSDFTAFSDFSAFSGCRIFVSIVSFVLIAPLSF